jgi:dihydrodipicolinate synthase/N-acetylneuraminate lyase
MTSKRLPGGIYPYLVTPSTADGTINQTVLAQLVDDLIEAGVNGVSPLGSTGEVMYLTAEQRRDVVRTAVEASAGRVPVVPGVAAFSTHDAVEQARCYAGMGVDGLIVMRQAAFPTDESGVVEYFATVARAVECPILLYTNPSVLGADLSISAIERLADIPNVRYLKDASGNTGRILSVMCHLGDRIEVFSASAHIPLLVFELGGLGWMAGPACVIPEAAVELLRSFKAGDRTGALGLQRELWPLNEAFTTYGLGACIKAALTLRGYDVGRPLSPQQELGPAAIDVIAKAIARADAAVPPRQRMAEAIR